MNQDIKDYARITGVSANIPREAPGIIDDLLRAIEWNPEGARAAVLRLVTLLTPPAEPDPTCARGGLAPWQKRNVERYLKENLDRPMHVGELAKLVSLSANHFSRAFKETFGLTLHGRIVQLGVELAQRLMLSTEDPLSRIAVACGLADQSHLTRHFRRGVDETPGAWSRRSVTGARVESNIATVPVRRAV